MDTPKVSIGIPVYNGENFIKEAIESVLNQTFNDFELIITDNTSTDKTEEICKTYAAKDKRIKYFRNENNFGATYNYNYCFRLAKGEYFKWIAHDDFIAPTFLEKCIKVLDEDSSIILCYSWIQIINEQRTAILNQISDPKLNSTKKKSEQFYRCLRLSKTSPAPFSIFGLARTDMLRKTKLIRNCSSSDRILIAELALFGKIYEFPECLIFQRDHPQQHYKVYKTRHQRRSWYDPNKTGKIAFPHWRLLLEHFISIIRAPLKLHERMVCSFYMLIWMAKNRKSLLKNLILKDH